MDKPNRNQVTKQDAAEALSDAELDQVVGGKSKKSKKKPSSYLQISLTNVHVSS